MEDGRDVFSPSAVVFWELVGFVEKKEGLLVFLRSCCW